VASADAEARALGHPRIGTEHLLLGVLVEESTSAAAALQAAGVTLAAARHKAKEATPPATAPTGSLPRTDRAERALSRAVRFSHARQADVVSPEHVLLGVLDVEGTAGQVLRGLGVDVDRLRAALEGGEDTPSAPEVEPTPVGATCPSCSVALADRVTYEIVEASGPRGTRDVVLLSCSACGHLIGAAKA
jgi:ATP-dependent Clp protease ATP-binding subunit ClpA